MMANDSKYHSFYISSAWRKLRKRKLQNTPLCEHCLKNKITTVATEVDHITPIVKDESLALDYSNLQSLCKSCHSRKTKKENLPAKPVDQLADRFKGLLK